MPTGLRGPDIPHLFSPGADHRNNPDSLLRTGKGPLGGTHLHGATNRVGHGDGRTHRGRCRGIEPDPHNYLGGDRCRRLGVPPWSSGAERVGARAECGCVARIRMGRSRGIALGRPAFGSTAGVGFRPCPYRCCGGVRRRRHRPFMRWRNLSDLLTNCVRFSIWARKLPSSSTSVGQSGGRHVARTPPGPGLV